jgi:hypothetical protein
MQTRRKEAVKGYTRFVQWNTLCRAALILGMIPNYEQGPCRKLNAALQKRVAAGKVIKKKNGESRSSFAFYAAKLPKPRRSEGKQDR